MWPAAGQGPASNIRVPWPQARPGMHPIQQVGPQKPLIRRFCPRVSSPILNFRAKNVRSLFRPASVFLHTVLYTSGTGPCDAGAGSDGADEVFLD